MLRLIGILLMAVAILILFAFGAMTISPQLRQQFTGIFCTAGETIWVQSTGGGDDRSDTIYCSTADGKSRDVSATYYIAMFASFLIPLYIGKKLYDTGKMSREYESGSINFVTPQQVTFTANSWPQSQASAATFQQNQITAALSQAEQAYQAGLISKEDLEKYRATIQQAQYNWQVSQQR